VPEFVSEQFSFKSGFSKEFKRVMMQYNVGKKVLDNVIGGVKAGGLE